MGKESQKTGKIGELAVMLELQLKDFDVYIPLVDVKGVDAVVLWKGKHRKIQVKTRGKGQRMLFDVPHPEYPDDVTIVLHHLDEPREFWVFPWATYKRLATKTNRSGVYRLDFGKKKESREQYQEFLNNWWPLKREGSDVAPVRSTPRPGSGRKGAKRRGSAPELGEGKGYAPLLEVAERLFQQGILKPEMVPVRLPGMKRCIVNIEPIHPSGKRFKGKIRLSNGLWLEGHASRARNDRLARRLEEHFVVHSS